MGRGGGGAEKSAYNTSPFIKRRPIERGEARNGGFLNVTRGMLTQTKDFLLFGL